MSSYRHAGTREAIGRFLLALPAAGAASIVTALLLVQLTAAMPIWLGEAIAAAMAAAVWMFVFTRLAPNQFGGSVVSFLAGTGVAWFLSRGMVHSVSPYYGLVSVMAASMGGALSWLGSIAERRRRDLAVGVVLTTLLVPTWIALATPALGMVRTLTDAHQQSRSVHVHFVQDSVYLWSAAPLDPTTAVGVELDPGSGSRQYRLTPVAATKRELVCSGFRADTRSLIADEVAGGHIPRFIAALPFRMADCAVGELWELRVWR